MRQYLGIKRNYPDCVLFFRMGDFYEMFFEDAKTASRALNIALTSRDKDGETKTPMCGIPYHALAAYLGKMVRAGHKVAICEQMEDPKQAKGIVKREVVRVVTPGTVTEDYLLDEKRANYLCAVSVGADGAGLSTADLSTGRFTTREFAGAKWREELGGELARIQPGEILVSADLAPENGLFAELNGFKVEKMDSLAFDEEEARKTLAGRLGVATLDGFGLAGKSLAVSSAGAVLMYVKKNSPDALNSLDSISLLHSGGEMELDSATLRNLEILQNLSDGGREGTLVDALDGTMTSMGARLFRERLVKPLTDAGAIMERQGLVTSFFENQAVRGEFLRILRDVGDFERCVGRIAGKNFTPRDFSSLLSSLTKLPRLQKEAELLNGEKIKSLLLAWDNVEELARLLSTAVNPDHPATFKEPGFIRSGYSAELDGMRAFRENFVSAIRAMEADAREATGINTLKIGYNKIYGYYIEVTNKHAEKVPPNYIRKQSLVNCERFVSPELKEMEEKLVSSEEKIKILEDSLVVELRGKTLAHLRRTRSAADLVAQLDVSAALADVAARRDYCAPEITDGAELYLEDSRHPVIEQIMTEENFVPNDVGMTDGEPRLMVITGPNMAGKSTYLRQVALAALMAQTGGYVAAKSARLGVADRIFTRVGAQDRLQKGLSTFMVEMVETANILNNATGKSLVILDEIGRGTSTFDGISIAWAVAEFLARVGARTIFATHYHELTDLALTEPGVSNHNVSVKEYREHLVFLRKVEPGPADKSYGIQVARLAGLPKDVLKRARAVLRQLEKMEFGADGRPSLSGADAKDEPQVSLFDARRHPALESLRDADLNGMTPLEAMNFLQRLKESAEL
jgi:DNA mismatch repair protein MutS